MSEATDKLILEMQRNEAPVGGWTMPDLRRLTGLTVGAFAAAVQQLRQEGKIHQFDLALVPALRPAPVPAAVVEAVEAEPVPTNLFRDVTLGTQLQEKALDGAPALAASIIRDRWAPTWERICQHARATGQRPVVAMIALLDGALDKDIAA
ncbi:hypothetical protein AI27_17960 [Sphingomonas sp. BHC-A]|nr:hypothetical protein AI27_17960 [Sphingomonas sp. BHC-A]